MLIYRFTQIKFTRLLAQARAKENVACNIHNLQAVFALTAPQPRAVLCGGHSVCTWQTCGAHSVCTWQTYGEHSFRPSALPLPLWPGLWAPPAGLLGAVHALQELSPLKHRPYLHHSSTG